MCFTWHGAVRAEEVVNLGPLALLGPLLERMQVAEIIDRHLPPDPQLEFSHGQVLSLLLAARLSSPTALVNVSTWAERSPLKCSALSRRSIILVRRCRRPTSERSNAPATIGPEVLQR